MCCRDMLMEQKQGQSIRRATKVAHVRDFVTFSLPSELDRKKRHGIVVVCVYVCMSVCSLNIIRTMDGFP
jgi:hypothetical protein